MSSLEQIKALREKTGAGIVDVKKALDDAKGNESDAIDILRKKGQDKALKRADRTAGEGMIAVYVHSNNRIAAMVKVACETDFVARNEDFQAFARDIAMHITAAAPTCITPEDVDEALVAKERTIWEEQLAEEGKPAKMIGQIMEGKEKKFRSEQALLTQSFVKDPDQTIETLLNDKISAIGEKIAIEEFVRYEL